MTGIANPHTRTWAEDFPFAPSGRAPIEARTFEPSNPLRPTEEGTCEIEFGSSARPAPLY